ncbi:hypothetical protein NKW53_07475 [Acetobacter orientalis]|uniref:hypothetical protein n=1 Tax=Acetobacter orientalis TaxID=146474 RepID=UPI0020A210C4|nr:hypothetical protein [Acetobacter orientalis]MCP1215900.1 hypothetical protein [Acetobacter orientalis]MCP1217940.1 hypothetical protein [Acetobacter orientalis]
MDLILSVWAVLERWGDTEKNVTPAGYKATRDAFMSKTGGIRKFCCGSVRRGATLKQGNVPWLCALCCYSITAGKLVYLQ